MKWLFWFAVSLTVLSSAARAETPQLGTCLDKANAWCVQPSSAVGIQYNLKTGDLKNGAVLVGYSLVHREGFRIGGGIVAGMGIAAKGQNAPQAGFLLSLAEYGAIGVSVQRLENGAFQWLVGAFAKLETR